MNKDIITSLRPAIVFTIAFALLLGLVYPLAITGIGQAIFPSQANGSIVRDESGKAIGSTIVGQAFTSDRYFNTRPSAAGDGYDGQASSGSNLGPTAKDLSDRVKTDVQKLRNEGVEGPLPADSVTASGSGLDPDLSPQAAYIQVPRIATARSMSEAQVKAIVDQTIERPIFGFLGEDHVNIFAMNQQLDKITGPAR